ncbi:RAQPRD family integrative conjugative element protein [Pseudomonas sp. Irchel 3A5]|uniref:integrative conjugative element protein, RAQPRD family n=1 Tax=Pseudomonas sp. Irchel 3A5 TaxID=2008911 RepID=UPI000BA41BF4|nr:RAQPRD family integrative conjugative element protein [Pseudomonas sp. Irchel 3A5]
MPTSISHHLAPLMLALLFCFSNTQANSPISEQTNLSLILRQLNTIDRITRSSESLPVEDGSRYTFDYPRLSAEIELIRQGIKAYQSPTRAQPRHPPELTGHYLREATDKP